jgi:hypothetical protein
VLSYRTIVKHCRKYATIGRGHADWYRVARDILGRVAAYRGWDYGTWVDVVSVCSPRLSVTRNLRVAYRAMDGSELPDDVIRSTRAALAHYRTTGKIRGPKTSRFARVLRGADNVVVVDTWMARALSVDDRKARSRTCQMLAERVIGRVAKDHGCCLSDAQAMVWAGVIRTLQPRGNVPNYRAEDIGLFSDVHEDGRLSDVPF